MRGKSIKLAVLCVALVVAVFATIARATIEQQGTLRVTLEGKLSPHALPRGNQAPVAVWVSSHISTTDGSYPPQLQTVRLAINRNGTIDYKGIPKCRYKSIQPSNNTEALKACGSSQVGTGYFSAKVLLPEQSPFPSQGKILAFNGVMLGHPVIFAHIYGTKPVPTSFVLPFVVRDSNGRYATTLVAYLPKVGANWGFIKGISLNLHRIYQRGGRQHSYLSAACSAPKGFPSGTFAFAKGEFVFAGGTTISPSLTSTCKVR
jgi:hypothetical protein